MTSKMVIELGKYVVMMIKAFLTKSGISRNYIPCNIMTSKQLDFKSKRRCPFGAYVQLHNGHNITNQIIDQNQGLICLGPTGSLQGIYAFLLIFTRRKITHTQLTDYRPLHASPDG